MNELKNFTDFWYLQSGERKKMAPLFYHSFTTAKSVSVQPMESQTNGI